MSDAKIAPYALQKLAAILEAHVRNNTATEVEELADSLQVDIPVLSRTELIELIENTLARICGETSRNRSGQLH